MIDQELATRFEQGDWENRQTPEYLRSSEIRAAATRLGLHMWERRQSTEFAFAPQDELVEAIEFMSFESARQLVGPAL